MWQELLTIYTKIQVSSVGKFHQEECVPFLHTEHLVHSMITEIDEGLEARNKEVPPRKGDYLFRQSGYFRNFPVR